MSEQLVWLITGTSYVIAAGACRHSYIASADHGVADSLTFLSTLPRSGIGKELSLALLERGEKVISTARARSLSKLTELKEKGAETLELDVTASLSELHEVAKKAVELYGRVDVVVNNAGYILSGTLEENTYVAYPGTLLLFSAVPLSLP